MEADDDTALKVWRIGELQRLGYEYPQRKRLLDMIEAGELDLEDVRHLADKGCPPEMAWWVLS